MSVRKSASRTAGRDLSGGAQAMRSLGFWALLAGASFIIGLFILSPLINVAAGSSRPNPAESTHAVTTPPPQPAPQPAPQPSASVAAAAERPERKADSDVGISVEKPKPAENADVQKPQGLDDASRASQDDTTSPREGRRSRRRATDDSETRTDRSTDRDSEVAGRTRDESGVTPDRGERTDETQRNDSLDRTDRADRNDSVSRDRSSDSSDESKPRRSRRNRRNRSDEEKSPSRERDAGGTDVQKGDSIDR